ncbi:MAG TPA: DNA polymerase III subunit epsilon [Paracoccaceae bacterium]|nr:DNA polymerase III subunit epsilon [Paracoccaceae bacterium]
MRQIVLDTETTGLDPLAGHRIVEIGAIELLNHLPTGQTWHHYLDPERDVPAEAFAIHGISAAMLDGKPVFAAIAPDFLAFLGEARLVIHNAAFDLRFLNAELDRAGHRQLGPDRAIDTLELARRRFPGAQISLDALCRRFGVDNSRREKHGALLDAEILAEIYLHLVGGRQPGLVLDGAARPGAARPGGPVPQTWSPPPRPRPLAPRLTAEEAAAHAALVAALGPAALWP